MAISRCGSGTLLEATAIPDPWLVDQDPAYADALDRIEQAGYDVFTRRISLSTGEKLRVVARAALRACGITG